MSAGLAQRLRAYAEEPCANGYVPIWPTTLREAATAIEERDALRQTLRELEKLFGEAKRAFDIARASLGKP